ncbi:MAG: redoxin domain-containing protein [Firmicutes bacterium]|nr:redoxin domain-containing protein [Bacillota bacterium]
MPMRLGTPLPSLAGATEWLGGGPPDLTERPVLIHFWSVSCHICHQTMPALLSYRERYGPQGLVFIGVHMPRFESETDVAKVQADIARFGIAHPVAVDNQHALAEAFQNEYVPAFFLFDREGKLFFRTAGDKGFEKLEGKIQQLLGLA